VGVETPGRALLVLPDSNYALFWHFEAFLVSAHEAGLGALILDLKDVAEFVPLTAPDGSLRTTNERMRVFTDAARRWLLGIGFSDITLVSFGTGTQPALDIIERSRSGAFNGWVDISGSASREKWVLATSSQSSRPRILFITGEYDTGVADRRKFASSLSGLNVQFEHKIVDFAGPMLLGEDGTLSREIEDQIIHDIFDWTNS
jgi:hypothetical protein